MDLGGSGPPRNRSTRAANRDPVPAPGSKMRATPTLLSKSEAMNRAIGAGVRNCPIAERSVRDVALLKALCTLSTQDRISPSEHGKDSHTRVVLPPSMFLSLAINPHSN